MCCTSGPDNGQPYPQGNCPWYDGGTGDAAEGGPLPACTGQCSPFPPDVWTGPVLLGTGGALGAPACPDNALADIFDGHANPITDALCGACSCTPPSGACAPPATITASSAACDGDGGVPTPFDPPSVWDGGCTTNDAVDAGELCTAPSCIVSLTIGPLMLTESGCTPVQAPSPSEDPGWSTYARGCRGDTFGLCENLADTCGPAAAAGFQVCVLHEGDVDCPSGSPYSMKSVFYQGYDDTLACSPCTCASTVGACSARLSVYSDGACGTLLAADPIGSLQPQCIPLDIQPSTALASKSLDTLAYTPGTCEPSGGVATGSLTPTAPFTFCCLASMGLP
jgi:hypothetical protein